MRPHTKMRERFFDVLFRGHPKQLEPETGKATLEVTFWATSGAYPGLNEALHIGHVRDGL